MTEPPKIASEKLTLGRVPAEGADVEAICRFAHTIDGYDLAGSFENCARIARDPDPRSLDQLRISLFYRFRSLRHTGEEESPVDLRFFRETIRRIRALLGEPGHPETLEGEPK